MINNDILRKLRFSFDYNDKKMAEIFALAELKVSEDLIKKWLKKDDDTEFVTINDKLFATFLNGLIVEHRGKGDSPLRAPETTLNNNIILQKLKIALNLKAEDIISLLSQVEFTLSKPELSAMFRKKEHKHYRECKDQLLRNFLMAVQLHYRKVPANSRSRSSQATTSSTGANKENPIKNKSARANASKIYVNPNIKNKPESQEKKQRSVLKLSPDEIWKNSQ